MQNIAFRAEPSASRLASRKIVSSALFSSRATLPTVSVFVTMSEWLSGFCAKSATKTRTNPLSRPLEAIFTRGGHIHAGI